VTLAERLSEEAKSLPDETLAEVLDFLAFLKSRQTEVPAGRSTQDLEEALAPYRVDMTGFRFSREEANER
jgi:hypothetical protein